MNRDVNNMEKSGALYTYQAVENGAAGEEQGQFAGQLDSVLSSFINWLKIHPRVKPLLKVDTIYNLYTPEIKISPKLKPGCADMRKVMSRPFRIENLYYAKHEPVDEATLDEFNQNTGNNVKKADVYLSRKALKEVQKPQVQVVMAKGI